MIKNRNAKVTILGAGPGNPELMTIAGVKALKCANVVLYDALVNTDILKWTSAHCKLVFVGKRLGFKRYTQEEINYLLISNAIENGHVVRLKGGDSFVFGRGSEECDSLASFGIEVEIIPGITSAIAAPASIGIPVTKRFVSEGFWVLTGTTRLGVLSDDIKLAAQSTSTVVILMGMSKLAEIVACYKNHERSNLPIAIIQEACTDRQRQVQGRISTILNLVQQNQISNPAVIVIGEVVNHSILTQAQDLVFNTYQKTIVS